MLTQSEPQDIEPSLELPIDYAELEEIYSASFGLGYRSLALCSPQGGEGMSLIAKALGKRITAAGGRVIRIDLNLASSLKPAHAPQDWRMEDEVGSLPLESGPDGDVLRAPLNVQQHWDLRDPNALRAWFERLYKHYDGIILETSGLNQSNRNNLPAPLLCSVCDACIMLVEACRTTQEQVVQAQQNLLAASVHLHGCVINDKRLPSLVNELCRETRRLDARLPSLMAWLRKHIRSSALLAQGI